MEKPVFVGKGTFGCVYKPDIPCSNQKPKLHHPWATVFVSKIQNNSSETTANETTMGKLIQTIPHYPRFFAPITIECHVNLSRIEDEELQKCDVLGHVNHDQSSQFMSTQLRYVGIHDLASYMFTKLHNPVLFYKRLLETHHHLLQALEKLDEHHLVHYDLHNGNIMMDQNYGVPIIIDFGLSFDTTKITYLEFYSFYPKHPIWPIEVVFLSYLNKRLLHKTHWEEGINVNQLALSSSEIIPIKDLVMILKYMIAQNEVFMYVNADDTQKFETAVTTYLEERKETTVEVFMKTLVTDLSSTWDNYGIAVTYLFVIHDAKHQVTNGTNPSVLDTEQGRSYQQLLCDIITTFPNRPTAGGTKGTYYLNSA